MGNGEAKEFICTTHGHEPSWGKDGAGVVQGIRSINGRHKIDRGRLRIVWEMEKPKNLHV